MRREAVANSALPPAHPFQVVDMARRSADGQPGAPVLSLVRGQSDARQMSPWVPTASENGDGMRRPAATSTGPEGLSTDSIEALRRELRADISNHHVRALSAIRWRILELASLGLHTSRMSALVGLSDGAVRKELARVHELIPVPLEAERREGISALWFMAHEDCRQCRRARVGSEHGSQSG